MNEWMERNGRYKVLQTPESQKEFSCSALCTFPSLMRAWAWRALYQPGVWPGKESGSRGSTNSRPHSPALLRVLSGGKTWSQGPAAKAPPQRPAHLRSRTMGCSDRSPSAPPARGVRWLRDFIPMNQRPGQRCSNIRWKVMCSKSKFSQSLARLHLLWYLLYL